ncbi:MAG: helicase-exonuclease AddAB subunit AddA [Clostridia bacterium]|nr:helicase-exonuclease AddAB subunit AddA [Clostridia bacterium]
MSRKWTPQQNDAINALDGSVLVSAAAGSGKTAVLTQRVIGRLTDSENPVGADRLLIVTFTRAAASEMRERISGALTSLIRKDPTNKNLINQQMLLPSAKICTIDSFCLDLVKENFQHLSVSPDFKIGDEGEIALLAKEAMDITMEQLYGGDSEGDFKKLTELLFSGRDDSNLCDMIEKLYTASMSFPFPEKWLDCLSESFVSDSEVKNSVYGKIILSHAERVLDYLKDLINNMLLTVADCEALQKAYLSALSSDRAQIEYIIDAIKRQCSWDEIRRAVYAFKGERLGRVPKEMSEDFAVKALKENRDTVKRELKKLAEIMCCSEEEYKSDMEFFLPMVRALVGAVKLYRKNFDLIKKEKKTADFSDITHMAISLLAVEDGDSWKSTPLAESLRGNFCEILIDEYQDTNAAQDMLFSAISDNNLFRVGDVKQSIYRFRQANPDIFISLKNNYEAYDREKNSYPAKIILGNNFRSRRGVTDIINFVFSQIMSAQCGDIDYTDEEKLVASAAYSEKAQADAELHLIETKDADTFFGNVSNEAQARHIAKHIKKMMAEGYTVKDGDMERTVQYKDFAVLLRATGGGKGLEYADVFRSEGIPCFTEVPGKFLQSSEISLVINILRVIDNPKQDIPLLSVMMSPVFGFTPDDVAKIRLLGKHDSLYTCILKNEGDSKTAHFLDTISQWRNIGVCLPANELLSEIYNSTALPAIFDAVDPSGTKKANLMLLCDYAVTYENLGYSGVSGFIGFIDRLSSKQRDISGSVGAVSDSNSVKVMTIHKSKGLEFPVCFIASCATEFNRRDEIDNLIISQKYGLGIVRRDVDTFEQYPTLCHKAIKLSLRKDNISEEMRVLYVAMTRAKEKLIMVYAKDNIDNILRKYASKIPAVSDRFSAYAVSAANGYGEWLLSAFLRHPDGKKLRQAAGISDDIVIDCSVPLKVVMTEFAGGDYDETQEKTKGKVNSELLSLIKERSEFRYKYEALSGVMTKRAASEADKDFIDRDYFASSAPDFLSEGGLTGAARGIATHTFIQFADYEKAKESVEGEINRLYDKGILTEAQAKAINVRAAETFFKSDLLSRILASDKVMREKKFTIEVSISEIYSELSEYTDEMMMIQGIADCAFLEDGKLVVVDYKTDSLKTEQEFIDKYASQVLLYKKALSMCTGYEVKETLLYSFNLGREIAVK